MEEACRHFNELLQANQRKSVRTNQGQTDPFNTMQQKYDNNDNNNSNIQEEETSAWLQSTMDDPFLRELWSDLFFVETKLAEDAGAPVEHVAMPDRPTKTKDADNEGVGGSSSSTGSGTSKGVITKKKKTAGGRHKRKGRKHEEESDYVQTDEENEYQLTEVGAQTRGASSSRRSRSSEVHNMSERRRRDRINEKMKALQELLPHCNKVDKASMLDEAIDYLKSLQLQVQMMWMAKGIAPVTPPNSQSHASFKLPTPPLHAQGHLLQVPKAEASPNHMAFDRISTSIGDRFSSLIEATSQTRRTGSVFDMHERYLELQQQGGTNSFGAYGSQWMQATPQNVQKWQDS